MLAGGNHAGIVEFADLADQAAAADKDFALAARVAGEGSAHQFHHPLLVERRGGFEVELLAGLVPNAAGEVDVLLLGGIPHLPGDTEQVGLLHTQSHVVDGGLFLVAHGPAHLLVRQALQRGLLDLHLEDLAQVAALLGQRLELRRLDVEFAGGTSHAHQGRSCSDVREAPGHSVDGGTVDGHYRHAVGITRHHIEHQVLGALCRAVGLITRRVLHQDGVGGVKDLVVAGVDNLHGGLVPNRGIALGDARAQFCFGQFGVHAVKIHHHAAGMLAAAVARYLVDGR